jgi:hypothetical protein
MARRGFGSTALRAALGAATGIGEGLQQREVLAAQRLKEQEAMRRQLRLDEAATRTEERQAIAAGMIPGQRFASMTMPGATPMEPALRQTIGGREFVLAPNINAAEKHRADVINEREARAKKAIEQTNLAEAFAGLEVAGRPLFDKGQSARVAKLPSNERSSLVSAAIRAATPDRGGKAEIDDDAKRLIGSQYLAANVKNPALMRALNTTYARNPAASLDPELTAYNIMKSKTVPAGITANKGYTPAKPKAGDAMDAMLAAEIERRKGGGAAKPAATPPTAQAKPIEPMSMAEAADKQARRADRWDQIKAQNPGMSDDAITAQVKKEIP